MAVADLCLVLGVLFAFTTLVLKIIEWHAKTRVHGRGSV